METQNAQKMKQKMENIEKNLDYIKENMSKIGEGPIFIELVGTPKSGKTTISNAMKNLFEKKGIKFQVRQETAEYNPIEDKGTEEYNVWMVAEIIKNLSEDMANKEPRIVLYDRGILDRIPWLDYAVIFSELSRHDEYTIFEILDTDFISGYKPLVYNFLTSPETSIARKGKEGRLVNRKSVGIYNDCLLQNKDLIESYSQNQHFIETDPYQGNLKAFLTDISELMTSDVKERIREEIDYNNSFKNQDNTEDLDEYKTGTEDTSYDR